MCVHIRKDCILSHVYSTDMLENKFPSPANYTSPKITVLLNFSGLLQTHIPKTLLSTPDELNGSYLSSEVYIQ